MGSVISNHLRHVSSNLQRVPPKSDSPKNGFLDTPTVKRRRHSPPGDDYCDDVIPATSCQPSVSLNTALGQGSNQSSRVLSKTDHFSKSIIESHHSGLFRREIKMELLEIVDKLDEMDEIRSLIDAEFHTRCTLEIFIAKHEEAPGGMELRCGEDVWRSQQMGLIRTISDDFGHITSHIILPRPFVVQAEDLFVKKRSKKMNSAPDQDYRLGLADQYVVKVWLEAPISESRWPPLELQSALDPNGRMMIWLRDGTFSSTDLRLMCKGVLFPEGGVGNSFDMILKLGGLQIQTNYTLRLDVQYSVAPQVRTRLDTSHLQDVESPDDDRQITETHSPDLAIKIRCLPNAEADYVYLEDNEAAENPYQKSQKPPPLTVPKTKRRLCDAVSKHILTPGEELHDIDENLETCWRTSKHVEMINNHPDISTDAKDYIIKWDSYVASLRLSSNFYVPRALLRFVEENGAWFVEQPGRVREFSLHATSLRLRGSIDIECFAQCVNLLQDFCTLDAALEETCEEIYEETSVGNTAEDAAVEEVADEETLNEVAGHGEEVTEEAMDGGAAGGARVNAETGNEKVTDGNDADQNQSDQDEVYGDAMNEDAAGDTQRLTPERDVSKESADEATIYVDASEELQILAIDDYVDAEDGEGNLQQSFYFDSYWQSITQRWPRLKLHGPYSFGVAASLAAIAIFQGFPDDNIDRLIAFYIHYCPNENVQDLVDMYYNAADVVPEVPGACMTELKLHRIMWEASRETCEDWLTDVYRLKDGSRRTVQEAIETATNAAAWDELWERIAQECSR
jgi:hypothetical protein